MGSHISNASMGSTCRHGSKRAVTQAVSMPPPPNRPRGARRNTVQLGWMGV